MTRLVVFDCDGTLVDSQHLIIEAMANAFGEHGLDVPPPDAIRHVVGLSLVEAVADLATYATIAECEAIAHSYRNAFHELRRRPELIEPMFDGAKQALVELGRRAHLLGMATGKSKRGADAVLAHHGLTELFVSVQTGDRHPSKPHPGMLEQVMDETGSRPDETVLIGDTTFDMAMARAARVRPIGVAWGYHPIGALRHAGAAEVVHDFDQLLRMLPEAAL